MIKITYVCDKCKDEHEVEIESNRHIATCPQGWQRPEVKVAYNRNIAFLFCGGCAEKSNINFNEHGTVNKGESSSAEKLIDLIFEVAEERGLINE